SGTVTLQVGANSGETMELKFTTEGINLDPVIAKVTGLDVSDTAGAQDAIDAIDEAIEMVSSGRSMLGAWQNRLEHTIANLDNAAENLQAAESRIRDVDMAYE